jgi:hypothetical protein
VILSRIAYISLTQWGGLKPGFKHGNHYLPRSIDVITKALIKYTEEPLEEKSELSVVSECEMI